MKSTNPTLASYMNYVSEEGLNLDRFVEHGGHLLGREEAAGLTGELDILREKIAALRAGHPLLARQLEFLVTLFESAPHDMPEKARNETIFALLYTVKDSDLMPDDMPEVGYLDDAAVVESVLARHAEIFERYCAALDLEWAALRSQTRR